MGELPLTVAGSKPVRAELSGPKGPLGLGHSSRSLPSIARASHAFASCQSLLTVVTPTPMPALLGGTHEASPPEPRAARALSRDAQPRSGRLPIRSASMSHRKRHGKKTPIIRRRHLPGSPPGEMQVDPTAPPSRVTVLGFGPDDFVERRVDDLDELPALRAKWPVLWVNVDGLGDERVLSTLAEQFAIHRLVMEDVVNVPQRAKVEPYGDMLFIVSQMIRLEPSLSTEQYSIIVGAGNVVTFQEHVGDPFDQVRERIRQDRGRMRRAGADFLAYALIDALVDGYFPVLEHYGERIEAIEEEVLGRYDPELAGRTHAIKRELLTIRRTILPHREVLGALLREEDELMHRETHVYLRDCYDHVFQLLDMVETYRELTSGLLEVHLTFVGNHMNEIMKVLTIFAAIFIPLSFIAGLYGMNFAADSPWNMPELRWTFGYPAVLGVMAVVAGGLLLFFRQRGWIGSRSTARKPAPHGDSLP